MKYRVCIDDNFHYMNEDERTDAGAYSTAEEAIQAAKELVLKSLRWEYKPGMNAAQLYDQYQDFGDDPFVIGPGPGIKFSAWQYAESMAASICEEQRKTHDEGSTKVTSS
mgnify:CR=1 FL=1